MEYNIKKLLISLHASEKYVSMYGSTKQLLNSNFVTLLYYMCMMHNITIAGNRLKASIPH